MPETSLPEPGSTAGRRPRPPYVSYSSFAAFLDRAAREDVPTRVDASLLARWGVAVGNESAMLTSLRALGVIEEDGRPTRDYAELRLGSSRRVAALRRCARRAYPELSGVPDATIQRHRLEEYFLEQRGLAGQMVSKAVRFYCRLAETIRQAAASTPDTAAPPSATSLLAGPETAVGAPNLTISLSIPFGVSESDLSDFFRRVRRAWAQAWQQ